MTVIKFPGHKRERCTEEACAGCVVCNLYCCVTCGGAETDLPTHCPGTRMDSLMRTCVQDKTADYIDGAWKFTRNGRQWRIFT